MKNLSIESIRVNYIFSFFLGVGTIEKNGKEEETVKKILQWDEQLDEDDTIGDYIFKNLKSKVYNKVEFHFSEEKEPLINRSAIYFKFPHLSIDKYKIEASITKLFDKEVSGNIRIHLALFETGMGLMWISIQVDDLHKLNILPEQISFINQRKQIPKILFMEDDKQINNTPHKLFNEELDKLMANLNQIVHSNEKLKKYNYYWNTQFWKDKEDNHEKGVEASQEPSLAILIKSSNFSNYINDKDFQLYVASILHGEDVNQIDALHAIEHIEENFINLYPNKNFFTRLHGNCLLVFHNEEYENSTENIKDYNSFKEFTYGLFRSYCAVRGTWYIYNMLNEEIESELRLLNKSIDNDFVGFEKAKKIKQYIILKSHFLQFLNTEDPFIRGIGLTPFANIYNEANKIYKPGRIIENIIYKLNEYDKLIHAINSYDFLKKVYGTSKKQVWTYPIITFTLFVILILFKYVFKFNLLNNDIIFYPLLIVTSIFFVMFTILVLITKNKKNE